MQIYDQDDQDIEDWHKHASGAVVDFLMQKFGGAMDFMVMVMFKPEGLAGIWQDGQAMLGRRKAAVEPCPEPNHAGGD